MRPRGSAFSHGSNDVLAEKANTARCSNARTRRRTEDARINTSKAYTGEQGATSDLALESRLDPAEFVRVHRSHLVRIDHIRRLEPCGHGEYELTLADGTRLTSSRSYREQVRRLLR